jgi:hypothetical protein
VAFGTGVATLTLGVAAPARAEGVPRWGDPVGVDPLVQQGEKLVNGEPFPYLQDFGTSVALSADGNTALVGDGYDEGGGSAWVFTRSGSRWNQQGIKLQGSGEVGSPAFGTDVALSGDGNTALIGGPFDNGEVGAAWVFTRSGETWSQRGEKLTGGGESGKGNFGYGLALSSNGSTALVGGDWDNGFAGAAWVFVRSGETWSQQGEKLTGSGEVGSADFGRALALSSDGNTALIGGGSDNSEKGAVWGFTRSGTTWSPNEKLTSPEPNISGKFGGSVALSADSSTALIGELEKERAWVFTRSGATWSQQGGTLTGTGKTESAGFGRAVALSSNGDTALIGGPYDGTDGNLAGAAWTFTRSGSTWSQQGNKVTPLDERASHGGHEEEPRPRYFGESVALSSEGTTALIGGSGDYGIGAVWPFIARPCNGLEVETDGLPRERQGAPYNFQLAACAGTPPYKWKKAGPVPKGVKLSRSGGLSAGGAKLTHLGSYPISVKVTDAKKHSATATLTLTVSIYGEHQ